MHQCICSHDFNFFKTHYRFYISKVVITAKQSLISKASNFIHSYAIKTKKHNLKLFAGIMDEIKKKTKSILIPYSLKVLSFQLIIDCAIHVPFIFIFLREANENKTTMDLFCDIFAILSSKILIFELVSLDSGNLYLIIDICKVATN